MSGCDRASAALICFFFSRHRQRPHHGRSITFVCASPLVTHTIQEDTIYLSSALSDADPQSQPPAGAGARRTIAAEYHQIVTVEPQENVARVNKVHVVCACMDACFVSPTAS